MIHLLLAFLPALSQPTYRVDRLEVNHVYSDDATPCFAQLLFIDWMGVQGWCMREKAIIGKGKVYLKDGTVIRFDRFEETHTQYDKELADRERIPVDQRRIRQ